MIIDPKLVLIPFINLQRRLGTVFYYAKYQNSCSWTAQFLFHVPLLIIVCRFVAVPLPS